MYNEVNNYSLYLTNFSFPISKGISTVSIDCTDWAVLYPMNDVAQGIACMWTWEVITAQFELYENDTLILVDYLSSLDVSFWSIQITEETADNTNLFSSKERMQEFYVVQWAFILLLLIFIFINKLIKFNP
jgi:hypothetical protein